MKIQSSVSDLAEAAAHRAEFDKSIATKTLFDRYDSLLVRTNAECLTDQVVFSA